jgi:hypothetical protein
MRLNIILPAGLFKIKIVLDNNKNILLDAIKYRYDRLGKYIFTEEFNC